MYFNTKVCVFLCMLFRYPSCKIYLILKFYVGLKTIIAVPSAVLQKWSNAVNLDENLDGLVIRQGWGRGVLDPCLPWEGANIQGGLSHYGRADTPLHVTLYYKVRTLLWFDQVLSHFSLPRILHFQS